MPNQMTFAEVDGYIVCYINGVEVSRAKKAADGTSTAEVIDIINDQIKANPTLEGTEPNLEGLEVSGDKYAVPQGGGNTALYEISLYISDIEPTNKILSCLSKKPLFDLDDIQLLNDTYLSQEQIEILQDFVIDNPLFSVSLLPFHDAVCYNWWNIWYNGSEIDFAYSYIGLSEIKDYANPNYPMVDTSIIFHYDDNDPGHITTIFNSDSPDWGAESNRNFYLRSVRIL